MPTVYYLNWVTVIQKIAALVSIITVFAWRSTGNISAEVFSMSKPSAWRSLVETATSVQGQATR